MIRTALISVLLLAGCSPAGPKTSAQASYAEDRALIQDLQGRYLFAMDWGDAEAYAETFAPDGAMSSAANNGKGRAAIAQELRDWKARQEKRVATDPSSKGKKPVRLRHNITNLVLEIRGDHAFGKAYWFALTDFNPERKAQIDSYGHYEDEMIKIDGQWYFKSRKIYNEMLNGREAPDKLDWPPAQAPSVTP